MTSYADEHETNLTKTINDGEKELDHKTRGNDKMNDVDKEIDHDEEVKDEKSCDDSFDFDSYRETIREEILKDIH